MRPQETPWPLSCTSEVVCRPRRVGILGELLAAYLFASPVFASDDGADQFLFRVVITIVTAKLYVASPTVGTDDLAA